MLLPLKGRKIYYDLAGPEDGPTVCITHSLASDSGMWAEQMAPIIGAGFQVLRVDMRGHGGSDPVPGDYTMMELADDVALVIDALGIAKVHYIGLSIGGMFGQGFGLKHGAKALSLMLCDTAPASAPGAKATWAPRIAAVSKANSLEPVADPSMERWLTDAVKNNRPGRWKQLRDTIIGTTPAGYLGCGAAIQNFDWLAQLPSIRIPTLVVCGSEDTGTPPDGNKRIASLIPGARYEEMAGARHFPNVEHPDIFNRIMMGWLAAQR